MPASDPAKRTVRRGYGQRHRELRRKWQAVVDAGAATCGRCGELVAPGARWHLGHLDGSKMEYRENPVEHEACNIAARNRYHARRRAELAEALHTEPETHPPYLGAGAEAHSRRWWIGAGGDRDGFSWRWHDAPAALKLKHRRGRE
jgi:hypothetical protein